jgi:hypothetical protein
LAALPSADTVTSAEARAIDVDQDGIADGVQVMGGAKITIEQLVQLVGIVGAFFAFFRGLAEYQRKNRLERYQQFITQRKEFEANSILTNVYVGVLQGPQHDMSGVPVWDRIFFLVFLENIALMMNSGLLSRNVVHNTWGNGVLQCWRNDSFWADIDAARLDDAKRSPYWRVFGQLYQDMARVDQRVRAQPQADRRYTF